MAEKQLRQLLQRLQYFSDTLALLARLDATELAETADSEAENLEKSGEMSSKGTKLLGKGTRRL